MKHTRLHTNQQIVERLLEVPRKIISLHDQDTAVDALMHELCHEGCFNFSKAAYFVDSPEFHMLKGISGIDRQEVSCNADQVWNHHHDHCRKLHDSSFNQAVRAHHKQMQNVHKNEPQIVEEIAHALHFTHPEWRCMTMKHGNHGLFIFEGDPEHNYGWQEQHLQNGIHLLAFCPIA